MLLEMPRLMVAGLSGDSGKTLVAIGLCRALAGTGIQVAPYKKGPDYIDAGWLGAAAGRPGRSLDTFMMDRPGLGTSLARSAGADLVLVEGNRGLYDGLDADGSHSSAELAKLLDSPVVLVVDVTKATRTVAAQVLGCREFDPGLPLRGVILNQVATSRQERLIRRVIKERLDVEVLGAIPRLTGPDPLPGRHLGLVTTREHPSLERALETAGRAVSEHVNLDRILAVAATARAIELPELPPQRRRSPVRIGVARGRAFNFYYPANLEALEACGAKLVDFSPRTESRLPSVDAVYFGGGFPEVHAGALADNASLRREIFVAAREGLPIWAECGGLMFLARELRVQGHPYPMAGVLDLEIEQTPWPQGHGYVVASIDRPNPFLQLETRIRGHEFHYSRPTSGPDLEKTVVHLERGRGLGEGRDGIVKGNLWASYLHVHALGLHDWATRFTALVRQARTGRDHLRLAGMLAGKEAAADKPDRHHREP